MKLGDTVWLLRLNIPREVVVVGIDKKLGHDGREVTSYVVCSPWDVTKEPRYTNLVRPRGSLYTTKASAVRAARRILEAA